MNKSIRTICILAAIFAGTATHAEVWPARLIKATIPFGAGSAADVVPRLVFDRLARLNSGVFNCLFLLRRHPCSKLRWIIGVDANQHFGVLRTAVLGALAEV